MFTLKVPITTYVVLCWNIIEASLTNSVDPDQTAPTGAVWSGSTLFVSIHKLVSTDNFCRWHFLDSGFVSVFRVKPKKIFFCLLRKWCLLISSAHIQSHSRSFYFRSIHYELWSREQSDLGPYYLQYSRPQGFSYLSEVGARGLLNLGKSIWIIKVGKTWCSLKELDLNFKLIRSHGYKKLVV